MRETFAQGLDAIVTRNAKFAHPSVAIWSVNDVIQRSGVID